jgi:hypothetical protein
MPEIRQYSMTAAGIITIANAVGRSNMRFNFIDTKHRPSSSASVKKAKEPVRIMMVPLPEKSVSMKPDSENQWKRASEKPVIKKKNQNRGRESIVDIGNSDAPAIPVASNAT